MYRSSVNALNSGLKSILIGMEFCLNRMKDNARDERVHFSECKHLQIYLSSPNVRHAIIHCHWLSNKGTFPALVFILESIFKQCCWFFSYYFRRVFGLFSLPLQTKHLIAANFWSFRSNNGIRPHFIDSL